MGAAVDSVGRASWEAAQEARSLRASAVGAFAVAAVDAYLRGSPDGPVTHLSGRDDTRARTDNQAGSEYILVRLLASLDSLEQHRDRAATELGA